MENLETMLREYEQLLKYCIHYADSRDVKRSTRYKIEAEHLKHKIERSFPNADLSSLERSLC